MYPIKCIFFDLDGVLVNSRVLHYETFRDALHEVIGGTPLTWKEHEKVYDGLSTRAKIEKLVYSNKINESQGQELFKRKQELTVERLPQTIQPRKSLTALLDCLHRKHRLFCVSNSIRKTVETTLELLGVSKYFENIYGNEDATKPKPSPELYMKAISEAGIRENEALIIEDSLFGREAAYLSGAHVLEVEDAEDVTVELLEETMQQLDRDFFISGRNRPLTTLHIVIPMAGEGSRFKVAGFTDPKPFIPVAGKKMIQWVLDNMMPQEMYQIRFHLIVRSAHLTNYSIASLFEKAHCNVSYTVHETDGLTEGAACSTLLASKEIDNDDPLIIVNSDQYLEWNPDSFYRCLLNPAYDGAILTFFQPDPNDQKWSYAKIDDCIATEVAEKKWISPYATVGLYGWKKGSEYVKYANQMIAKNIRTNNEFYVCPVYNEAIQDGKRIRVKLCKGMWGLGVPDDLQKFLTDKDSPLMQ